MLDLVVAQAKAAAPLYHYVEHRIRCPLDIDDARFGAYGMGHCRLADLASGCDQADAKAGVVAHTARHHGDITRFKDFEWQPPTGEQHGMQGKKRQ